MSWLGDKVTVLDLILSLVVYDVIGTVVRRFMRKDNR